MTSQITPAGVQAREPREVDGRLGLARALQDAAGLGLQREDVAGLDEVGGRVAGSTATRIVCARSAAEMPVVTPSRASIETRERASRSARLVLGRHQLEPELVAALGRQRQADPARGRRVAMKLMASGVANSAAIVEVALVLAVLVVDDDDHPPGGDVLERLLDGREAQPRATARLRTGSSRPAPTQQLLDVLRQHVHLQVHDACPARPRRASCARSVSGMSDTSKPASSTRATVSETPSTAIEPFSTT